MQGYSRQIYMKILSLHACQIQEINYVLKNKLNPNMRLLIHYLWATSYCGIQMESIKLFLFQINFSSCLQDIIAKAFHANILRFKGKIASVLQKFARQVQL